MFDLVSETRAIAKGRRLEQPDGQSARDEASRFLGQAVQAFPRSARLRMMLGVALSEIDRNRANDQFAEAVQLCPEDPVVLTEAASHMASIGNARGAEAVVQRVVEIAPPDFAYQSVVENVLGRVADHHGRDDEAERHLRRALDLEPGDQVSAATLMRFLCSRGRVDEATAVVDEGPPSLRASEFLQGVRAELIVAYRSCEPGGQVGE